VTVDHALGNHLRVERAKRSLTQQALAEMVGVSRKTINTIETGRFIPSTLVALRMARALQVSVEELFFLADDASPDAKGA
jgi:putative transcriptional regulator